MTTVKPFLKWAGNKTRSLKHILPLLPASKRLIEPFTGSGAVFLNAGFCHNLLGEANADLIHVFQYLQREGQRFIDDCYRYFKPENNEASAYADLKEQFNQSSDPRERACLFIYLNRHGYNGLCRYNSKGIFNVPFGRYRQPHFPGETMLKVHHRSQGAVFVKQDYRSSINMAEKGDVIYCDPPYIPLSKSASFSAYTSYQFAEADQIILADLARDAVARGATVLISNHDVPLARELYQEAEIISFPVSRMISCKHESRDPVRELLAIFKP